MSARKKADGDSAEGDLAVEEEEAAAVETESEQASSELPPEPPVVGTFALEQQAELALFRDEVEVPSGLHHGMWLMERQYVCDFCDVGYLDLAAAQTHLESQHSELLRELAVLAELKAIEAADAASKSKSDAASGGEEVTP